MALYQDQYALFGDPEVLPVKVIWDYTYYWGVLCQLFFQGRLTDRNAFAAISGPLARARRLNTAMQDFMRTWGDATTVTLGSAQARADNPLTAVWDGARNAMERSIDAMLQRTQTLRVVFEGRRATGIEVQDVGGRRSIAARRWPRATCRPAGAWRWWRGGARPGPRCDAGPPVTCRRGWRLTARTRKASCGEA